MSGSPPSGPRLRRWLRLGVAGAAQRVAAREELGLPEAADDRALARALVQVTAALDVAALDVRDRARVDARPSITPPPVPDEDPSFLGELSVSEPRDELAQIDDTRTLLAVLRAGTLRQRRAVLEQLGEGRGSLRSSAGRSPREVVEALDGVITALDTQDAVPADHVRQMKAGFTALIEDIAGHEIGRLYADEPRRLQTYAREIELYHKSLLQ